MKLNNFELIPFNNITAINIYKNDHAKSVSIKNSLTFPGCSAADCTSEPGNYDNEKKGVSLNFSVRFPELDDSEPFEVLIHFEINDSFEYVVAENLLDGVYHEKDNPWRTKISRMPLTEDLSEKLII